MRPLDGVRVLDASRMVSGPVACFFLAALGAEVIRVEAPGGDPTWQTPPFVGPDGVHRGRRRPHDIGLSPLRKGRGKRSVVLDLKTEAGRDAFRRLALACDVLVENGVPGTMARLGLDWPALSAIHPRLVYCSVSGYGPSGPYRDHPSMDLVVQAVSGLMAKTGFPDGPPTKVGATVGDQVPALFAALGIVAALRQRERSGRGQLVDVAMLDALVTLLWDEPLDDYEDRGVPERYGNGDPRGTPLGTYATRDGWVALVLTSDAQWRALALALGRPELAASAPGHRERIARRDEIEAVVAAWCRERTSADALAVLRRCEVPAGPVQSAFAARRDPQVAHRGALVPLEHPDLDAPTPFLAPAFPVRFSDARVDTAPAEPLGRSTEAVLRELLGADDAEIARLRAAGALGPAPEAGRAENQ